METASALLRVEQELRALPETFDAWAIWLAERGAEIDLIVRNVSTRYVHDPENIRYRPTYKVAITLTVFCKDVPKTRMEARAVAEGESPLLALRSAIQALRFGAVDVSTYQTG